MRTTIEMKSEHREKAMQLASSRGEKGFSNVVADALDLYFTAQTDRAGAIRGVLALKGSMAEDEGAELSAATRRIRANWR